MFAACDPITSSTNAEYTCVFEEECAKMPRNFSYEESASLAFIGVTCYSALQSSLRKYSRVFVNGGNGAVGAFAIQYLKNEWDCQVSASCSSENEELVRKLGADKIVHRDRIFQGDRLENGYDLFLDGTPDIENDNQITKLYKQKNLH